MDKKHTCSSDLAVLLEDVVYEWPGQKEPVLDIPHFSATHGEHIFIAGPSGCGKSTLLGLVAGILSPFSGSVCVNGVRLEELGAASRDTFRGDHIGFIFQQFNLVPYLSILENVLLPCRFSEVRRRRACAQGRGVWDEAKNLLERLDLAPSIWDTPVNKLSVGQQQRVAAARALVGRPSLIIADEPTSSLDANRRKAFLHLLLEECQHAGTSLLFVSHDLSLADTFGSVVYLPEINRVVCGVNQ